jgi:hypothetical protein
MDLMRLAEPFSKDDIQWRISEGGVFFEGERVVSAKALAYISNRAIQNRLDEVCGPEYWQNTYREWHTFGSGESLMRSQLCGISILVATPDGKHEWVTKWDGAECTDISMCKGGLSDSMKRAAVHWGIGRYLYEAGQFKAIVNPKGKNSYGAYSREHKRRIYFRWDEPILPDAFLPICERKNRPAAEPPVKIEIPVQEQVEFDTPWKNQAIHFGRAKGVRLGSLTPEQLLWFQERWLKQKENGALDQQDIELINALKASMEGGAAPPGPRDEIPF